MADCFSVQSAMMRDKTNFIIENGVDNFDTASQGSRDDCVELDPRFMEDRFRVDRKKLEQMLQMVPGDEFREGAEDFFQRVMDETNTQITWPSKLKIGAKSKKDPHIKVIGFPDDVRAAKAKIMSILDTKSNRVTLKMDVSHTEHSHVIGKGGNNIKRVMMETGCHIHFPDSNRGNSVQEKSNQVSIAGQPAGVENARAQIRELLPLVFMFELPTTPAVLQAAQDTSSVVVQQVQQMYNVTITFKQRPRMPITTVVVRGSVINAKSVKEATGKLMETFTGMASVQANLVVSMHLEIAPQHHLFIIGRQGSNVKSIMQSTNSSILFPDPSTSGPQRKGTVVIRGSIESVFCARQHLIGCLPLVLMFDVKEEIELEQGRLTQLMEQLDVFISVKPKPKQPSKSVIVKSIERNARNMYLARLLLLGLHPEGLSDSLLKAASNSARGAGTTGLGLTSLGFLNSHSLLNVSTPSSLVLMNGHSNPQSPSLGSPLSAAPNLSPSHWLHGSPGLFSPLMVVAPASSVPASFDVLSQCNGFQKDFAPASPFIRMSAPQSKGTSSNNSDSASPPAQSPCDSPRSGIGFRHGTTVELGGLQSEDSMENVITRDTSTLSSSGHTLDLLGLSKTTPISQPPPVTATLFNGMSRLQNGEKSPESSGAESDGSEKLAPGIERKNSSSSLFTPLPFPFDYEQKKLLAMKAMQKHPEGESRIPTDIWSGMGFSKSMPESAIRDRLGQLGISHARFDEQGPLQPPAEFAEAPPDPPHPESDSDIDRDPWKDSKTTADPYLNKAPGEYPSLRKKYDYGMSHQSLAQQQRSPQQLMAANSSGCKVDLAELFSKLGLGKYTDLFQQQEIDLGTFLTMTDQDLKELGITTFGARRKMLLAIADLNKGHTLLQQAQPRALNNPFSTNGAMSSSRRPDLASLSGVW